MSSVRTHHFSKSSKTKQSENNVRYCTGETVGLAEWIIDDTCLVLLCLHDSFQNRKQCPEKTAARTLTECKLNQKLNLPSYAETLNAVDCKHLQEIKKLYGENSLQEG